MFNFTNKNAGNTTRWLILGALGILLIINRRFALNIAYIIFAIGLMLAGAASAFGWWERRGLGNDDMVGLVSGIAMFVVGLWIIRNPNSFDKIINVLIGLVLIVTGASWLNENNRTTQDNLVRILSIVAIVVGIMITFSRAATGWIATAGGIGLIYTAVTGLIGEKTFHN